MNSFISKHIDIKLLINNYAYVDVTMLSWYLKLKLFIPISIGFYTCHRDGNRSVTGRHFLFRI